MSGKTFGSNTAMTFGFARNPYETRKGQALLKTNTGYSQAGLGYTHLDPSIRALQEEALGQNRDLYGQLGEFRSNLLGSNSAYVQARVNPLLQQQATRRGELERGIGMRGLGGSSFGQQSLTGFDIDTDRAISDQRALATHEGIQSALGTYAMQAGLSGQTMQAGRDRLQMELSALGLGQQQIQNYLQAYENEAQRYHQFALQLRQNMHEAGMESFNTIPGKGVGGGAG